MKKKNTMTFSTKHHFACRELIDYQVLSRHLFKSYLYVLPHLLIYIHNIHCICVTPCITRPSKKLDPYIPHSSHSDMRRLGVQGLIFFYLVYLRSCATPSLDCRIPFFQNRLLRSHTLLASPPELSIRTRCLVPSCECGSRFCRRWQVPQLLCRNIL
ncbi:unnamed protein product [Trichogramma brassicae]|uniref:Uncharacterized protein n=1 Tax=Trichogramma brassicae TaxID=86971 RepID=A0A6H5J4C8_9HYME|nr:unnamed protein product [Trichogramma brassicae]